MTREWVSERDRNWVMRCDRIGCGTRSETFPASPPLELFRDRGWFIGWPSGDRCPACLEAGLVSTAKPFRFARPGEGGVGQKPVADPCDPVDADAGETVDEYAEVES